jgi:hypothetical protein
MPVSVVSRDMTLLIDNSLASDMIFFLTVLYF